MSKISKPPRATAVPDGPAGDGQAEEIQLYADRVRVYPSAVQGIARNVKWAVLILCLVVYYFTPWIHWAAGRAGRTRRCCWTWPMSVSTSLA